MKYIKVPGTYFELKLLTKANKFAVIDAVLEAVMAYGNGEEPEEILEALCDVHREHLSHAWLAREVAVPVGQA